jgi:hypothetical protein
VLWSEREYVRAIQLAGGASDQLVEGLKGRALLDLARAYSNLGVTYQAQVPGL